MAMFWPALRIVSLTPGGTILAHVDGVMAAVTVVRDPNDGRRLKVNNRFQMGGTASQFSDRRQAHITLLLHPDPRRALFLGVGTGATLAAAADHPHLQAEGVELIGEIIPLIQHFPEVADELGRHPRLQIKEADARRYVQACRSHYDVVIADLFHPSRDGAGSLYTLEHFQAIRQKLNPGGIFCQWLPLYQLDLETFQTIARTFLEVYPHGMAVMAHDNLQTPIIGLVGGAEPRRYALDWFERRVDRQDLRPKLRKLRFYDIYTLMGCYLANAEALRQFAGPGPLNTDDQPVVTFMAPRFVYGSPEPPAQRLLVLLDNFTPDPEQLMEAPDNAAGREVHRRLSDYWAARNLFLRAGAGVASTRDPKELLHRIAGPLLSAVRQSADYAAAYNPLLALAQQLFPIDPDASLGLLRELESANPQREEARRLGQALMQNSETSSPRSP
jgi:spermidine synthase